MSDRNRSVSIGTDEIAAAAVRIEGLINRTPTVSSSGVDTATGNVVALKAESLQQGGSFKIRGASAKLTASPADSTAGVVAGTAGNHGQAVALAARRLNLRCDLFVPEDAPLSKTVPARLLGATIHTLDGSVDDCVSAAREFAAEHEVEFVHPFDDPDVIAGQGTIGLELLDQVPGLSRVVVPLGGGGLASGIAIAVRSVRPEVEVIGVQVEACASFPASLEAAKPVMVPAGITIADGIAVKRPGDLTLPLIRRWLDRVVVVGEDEVGDAMALLLREAKLVVEGAGAVGIAAMIGSEPAIDPADGTTAVILSGGNIDEEMLVSVARRSEAQRGRGLVLLSTIPDRPGSLARLLEKVGQTGGNVVDVGHIRDGVLLGMSQTGVELVLETRGIEHAESIVQALREGGYPVREVTHTDEKES